MDNKMYCTNCGAEMDPNASICVKCGVNKGKVKKYCAHCGKPVSEEQDVCTNCGAQLSNRIDISKGKDTIKNLSDKAIKETGNLAELASKKTGKRIKPVHLISALGALVVVIVAAVFLMMPKHLDGTYTTKVNVLFAEVEDSYIFDGDKFTEKVDGDKRTTGTYEIKDGKVILKPLNGESITGELSKDKKTITIDKLEYKKNEEK
ncbi:zinc ribbon domain-containing protein [Ligilactobacillus animalis]|nr:zinc ribbon domain-containing protein [Ligilactobacillus animalis]